MYCIKNAAVLEVTTILNLEIYSFPPPPGPQFNVANIGVFGKQS